MAELLQTHRPRVALSTFGTWGLLPTHPPAYKNVPRTHGYRKNPPDASIAINMEDQAQGQIERILDRSLDKLSAEDVMELRRTSERSLVLDKVSPAEYLNWLDKVGDDIRGVEYDAQNACIVLKGCPGWMHEAATGVIYRRLFGELEDRLSAATVSDYMLTGSIGMLIDLSLYMDWFITIFLDCLLDSKYDGSIKQADASLMEFEAEWPAVVLEVGISETTEKLCEDVNRWLNGSDGNTKLVILINVQEIPKWNLKASHAWKFGCESASFVSIETFGRNTAERLSTC